MPDDTFYGLGIAPRLLEALDKAKFIKPTPIQKQSIPIAIQGKDIVGIAQTGTGKTLAFGIPLLQRIATSGGRGLVVLPTRELALQVEEVLMKIGRQFNLRTAVLIGGASMDRQIRSLRARPHLIVATPGRLIDHLEQRILTLDDVRVVVLDEADRMLDMGFAPQLKQIMNRVPKGGQTMLFSATMPPEIMKLATVYLQLPIRVEVAPPGTAASQVTHELFVVPQRDKIRLLERLLGEYRGTVLVFSRTKHGAKKIALDIRKAKVNSAEIHSNRTLAQRREALDGFKSGKYRVLVATDIAARGIDVTGIELVLNFDLPDNPDDYVHRIGRTGRAGKGGHAISFAAPGQGDTVRQIERLIRRVLPISRLPELPPARAESRSEYTERSDSRRNNFPPRRSSGHSSRPQRGGYRRDR
ncbi:MAG: DEAD/DEAH box helicase [Patescibacteria group bacterium]